MNEDVLRVDRHGAVLLITMNRPQRRNALDGTLDRALLRAFRQARQDDDIRAVVLTGAGSGFCAGADLTVLDANPSGAQVRDHILAHYLPLVDAMTTLEKPVLAAVNGAAAGAGCSLALACDLRVMANDAYLLQAFSNIGLVPDAGSTWFLARQVGYARAYQITIEGQRLPAERCLELGLANRVVAADRLLEETMTWATHLAARPTLALGLTKRALHFAQTATLGETIEMEARQQERCADSADHREGVQAFLEKRQPTFTGR